MKIQVGSDFSGVGAFDQALKKLGINYETVFTCDMDKYARMTYVHNYGEPKYYPKNVYDRIIPGESLDIYMSSPPCQSFSLAGKRKGEDDHRGILFYNTHEFIKGNKPRFFIIENVKGLLSDDGGRTFKTWIDTLAGKSVNGNPILFPREDSVPYHVYWSVLNAKDYGVPQNRERVFIVGIRDDEDNNFSFPKTIFLEKRIKDILEEDVDKKYYLSDKIIKGFNIHKERHSERGNGFKFEPQSKEEPYLKTIPAKCGSRQTDPYIIEKEGFINQDTQASKVYGTNGILSTIIAGTHGYALGYIKVPSANKKGYEIAEEGDSLDFSDLNSKTKRGKVGKKIFNTIKTTPNQAVVIGASRGRGSNNKQQLEINKSGLTNTITSVQKDNLLINQTSIRRLTPRECFRAMGFPDEFDFSVVSDTQAYKQAGNSIVVDVLAEIISKLPLFHYKK